MKKYLYSASCMISTGLLTGMTLMFNIPFEAKTFALDDPLKDNHDPGTPITNDPGTTRPENNCDETDYPVTAIVMNKGSDLTLSVNPTLWFYLPLMNNQVSQVEFILKDKDDLSPLFIASGRIVDGPGWVRVKIPEAHFSLEENELYHWYFQVYCPGEIKDTPDQITEGWIQHIATNLDATSSSAKPQDIYQQYVASNIWYDAIHLLLESSLLDPSPSGQMQELVELMSTINQHIDLSPLDVTSFEEVDVHWEYE